jgi:hypothetical protein
MRKTLFLSLFCCRSFAQIPTGTEIWLVDLDHDFNAKNAVNITHRDGYDNQPAFSRDGKYILYTSIHEDKQADIYKYTIATKETERLTFTPESEYSPTFMRGGKSISTVRVEADSSQRLWKFDLATLKPVLINKYIDSIGYHCWVDDSKLAVFILTEPFTLQLMDVESNQTKVLAKNIGRSMHRAMDGESIIFTQLIDSVRWICSVNVTSGKTEKIVKALDKSEDLVMLDEHIFMMAQGGQLFTCNSQKEKEWKPVCNLVGFGIKNITRIARSSDGRQIAVVDNN